MKHGVILRSKFCKIHRKKPLLESLIKKKRLKEKKRDYSKDVFPQILRNLSELLSWRMPADGVRTTTPEEYCPMVRIRVWVRVRVRIRVGGNFPRGQLSYNPAGGCFCSHYSSISRKFSREISVAESRYDLMNFIMVPWTCDSGLFSIWINHILNFLHNCCILM